MTTIAMIEKSVIGRTILCQLLRVFQIGPHFKVPLPLEGQISIHVIQEMQREVVTFFNSSTGMFMGQAFAHFPQPLQASASRFIAVMLNLEKGYLLIRGSVPGAKNSFIKISKSVKK